MAQKGLMCDGNEERDTKRNIMINVPLQYRLKSYDKQILPNR